MGKCKANPSEMQPPKRSQGELQGKIIYCRICSEPNQAFGTQLCIHCYNLSTQIAYSPRNAVKILKEYGYVCTTKKQSED